jgi:hypothetical protein
MDMQVSVEDWMFRETCGICGNEGGATGTPEYILYIILDKRTYLPRFPAYMVLILYMFYNRKIL